MQRIAIAVALLALTPAKVAAQSDPIKERQALMKKNDAHGRTLSQMARGRAPFDKAKVDEAMAQFADTAAKLPGLFPDNSKTGKTDASPKIWENKADFDAKAADFAKAVADNRDKAGTSDGLGPALGPIGKTCDNCHDKYRLRR